MEIETGRERCKQMLVIRFCRMRSIVGTLLLSLRALYTDYEVPLPLDGPPS